MRKNLIGLMLMLSIAAAAQKPGNWSGSFFKGYGNSIRGGGFVYHSPEPDVNTSLLVRSADSSQFIEWDTEILPAINPGEVVKLIWIFGMDATIDSHPFRLFLNGTYLLSFSNPVSSNRQPWTVSGQGGATLTFRPTMLDKYDDPMGYAILTLPGAMIKPGQAQRIRISGESGESRSWYMTFESGVEEKLEVRQEDVVIRGQKGNLFSVLFQFVHLGEPVHGSIEAAGGITTKFILEPGYNRVQLLLPEDTVKVVQPAWLRIEGKEPYQVNFKTKPVRKWNIILVQHAHTDIGYTRPQTEILPEHLRYIDYALDFCDQTDKLPVASRFHWTCETSWAVREYLNTRPDAQTERLRRRVREGRIELTGLFLNSSDLSDEVMVAASLQPIRKIRASGFPVRAAMQSDINGVPWCLTDYLSGAGISYLNMAQNTHRAHKPFDKPTAFWWESPSGNRILVNRPEHYMWGNNLGILTNVETFTKNLLRHLEVITENGYTWEDYAIQFSGYLTDNSPPSTTACKIVSEWNDKYVWPKLKLATLSAFFDTILLKHGETLPVYRGAWPDWWLDGFGSAAMATSYARKAHADYISNLGLAAFSVIMGVPANEKIRQLQSQITDDLAFYDEHTFGAAESISDPECENSVVQEYEKLSYVWEAVKKNGLFREEVMGRVQDLFPRSAEPSVTVFNTLNWTRSGLITLYIDHQMLPRDKEFRILDDHATVPAQPLFSREDGTYWAVYVADVWPMGYKTLRIVPGTGSRKPAVVSPFKGTLENAHYRLTVDTAKAVITGLYDKEMGRDLVDQKAPYPLAAFIYERLGKNRAQLEMLRLEEFTRTTLTGIRVGDIIEGPVWNSIMITGQSPECADGRGVSCEIRLYHTCKKLEFCFSMVKKPVTDPEGVYVAFPFILENGSLVYETAGGIVVPGSDQIEGSSSDWNGIQNFISVRNDQSQIVMVSPEIPLVQPGEINTGKFHYIRHPQTGKPFPASTSVFSWVLNNYWTTNFLASQEGELKWSYQITSANDPSNTFATQFGWNNRIPLLTRIFPGSVEPDSILVQRSFIGSSMGNILMVSCKPAEDGNGIILHLRETEGKTDSIPLDVPYLSSTTLTMAMRADAVAEVNVLEEHLNPLWTRGSMNFTVNGNWLRFRPFETKFIRVTWPPNQPQ